MFTAVAIMQLVDEGSVDLDKPFTTQLGLDGPFADPRVATITVRQLMSHTSGFRRRPATSSSATASTTGGRRSTTRWVRLLQFDPGTGYQYSNTNFCILGKLIETRHRRVVRDGHPRAGARADRHPCASRADVRHGEGRRSARHVARVATTWRRSVRPAAGSTTPTDIAKLAAALRDPSSRCSIRPTSMRCESR